MQHQLQSCLFTEQIVMKTAISKPMVSMNANKSAASFMPNNIAPKVNPVSSKGARIALGANSGRSQVITMSMGKSNIQ